MKILASLLSTATVVVLAACGVAENEVAQTQAVQPYEDCVSINYATATVQNVGGRWKIMDGSHMAFDFGSKLAEAQKSLQIIKNGQVRHSCFVKRPNATFKYLLNGAGNAISGNLAPSEDCIAFNPASVSAQNVGGRWKLVSGSMLMLDFGIGFQAQQNANLTRTIVQAKGFDRQCFVGRPDPSFSYWKRTVILPPPPPPSAPVTLESCTDHLAIAGGAFQCPGNKVAVGLFDRVEPMAQFESVRCCSLKAAGATVFKNPGISYANLIPGTVSRCPANSFVTGVRFSAAGAFQGVQCQSLYSASGSVVYTGFESTQVLSSGYGGTCSGHALMTAIADTAAPDSFLDTIHCQNGLRL